MKHFFSFTCIRLLTLPFAYLPYPVIHSMGKMLGLLAYLTVPKFRKRALSNLSLASDLRLTEKETRKLAKQSCQNLMITTLEYAKLAEEKDIRKIALCENPEEANRILSEGKGIIFFCAHQANWEILFLEGTSRMPGVAIGRPVENEFLYNWILSIRQKFGGKIIAPKNAAREGLRALKKGMFLGIVGDQGMPDSGFQSIFLGRRAWTSPLPAILSYRTGCPIIFASTKRKAGKYLIHYSDPIWPNGEEPIEKEIKRLMEKALSLLEKSIHEEPGQWMWQHNRWKQQTPEFLKAPFRQEAIGLILPEDKKECETLLEHLPTLRKIYPLEFFTFFAPEEIKDSPLLQKEEVIPYRNLEDILKKDYRFKLLFNFHGDKRIRSHYLSLSAFDVVTLNDLKKAAKMPYVQNYSHLFEQALLYAK